jgi:hypothetical protein
VPLLEAAPNEKGVGDAFLENAQAMKRKDFLGSSATLLASSGVNGGSSVPGGTHFVERRADFDAVAFARVVDRPAAIRQVVEAVSFRPGTLGSLKNSINGFCLGFGYSADSIALAFAAHGPSAVYAYTNRLWATYRLGEFFKLKDAVGSPIASNVFLQRHSSLDEDADPDDTAGMYQDSSIEMLQHRGVIVLTCHTAVEEQARAIVSGGFAPSGATAAEVAKEILSNLIPGALVVPSMVATIGVLQTKYRYSYRADL